MMRAGVVLSTRVLISFGMVMYASALCVRMGSTTQASFEVVRQVRAAECSGGPPHGVPPLMEASSAGGRVARRVCHG